ncbi:expressed protein [Dictyostelium purpureum]|uniref:Expressed protein n=1 Tax=Dictyostelium purpureum TaxID=5786 RepID=F0Z9F4_DICPU|nr:uncharacterized protein DICPUDRAFT_93595 [Dictyostelium purpureum]EGC39373.1 expressed protein [Dictyostelium purpureum]|eukprot:XP_003284047.1 expressed protein [Dictyostelium purpureum]
MENIKLLSQHLNLQWKSLEIINLPNQNRSNKKEITKLIKKNISNRGKKEKKN